MKRTKDSLRDLWDNIKCTNIWRRRREKKEYEKIFEEIRVENFPSMGKEKVQEAQSPIQDKPKGKHAKTYTNQSNKD